MESERRQQCSFSCSVIPFYISRRIGLGISLSLRLSKSFIETSAGGRHLVEDVVRRAIDDAHNTNDLVPDEGFTQRTNDRNCASHGGFVVQIDAIALSHCVQFSPMSRQQSFIRCHD